MRKLIVAAAVAAIASLGVVGTAHAQSYNPGTTQGTYGTYNPYPGTHGSYPPQAQPTYPSQRRDANDRYADHDRLDRKHRRADENAARRSDSREYGYGSGYGTGTTNAPSRVAEHTMTSVQPRSAARNGHYDARDRDSRDRDSRDRR